jgi:hypothetical protein
VRQQLAGLEKLVAEGKIAPTVAARRLLEEWA